MAFHADEATPPGQRELLVLRSGADGMRLVLPDPGGVAGQPAEYTVVASPGPAGSRGPFSAAGRWVAQRVLFPVVDRLVGPIAEDFVKRWEDARRPHEVRRWTTSDYRLPSSGSRAPETDVRGAVLIVVHGTNSLSHSMSGTGAITETMLEELVRRYDGNVFAFDHPTLATHPLVNAQFLVREFLEANRGIRSVDFLCHSRGGLVARAVAEDLEYGPVRSISMVGTPNRGTPLADAAHLGRFVDRLVSLESLVPDNPVTPVLEGAITLLKQVAVTAWGSLDGIAAMAPGGEWMAREPRLRPDVAYRSLIADFEPPPGPGSGTR